MLTFPINNWSGSSVPINSLRFASPSGSYLTRTPTVAGNRKLWTFAAWVKRGQLSTAQNLLTAVTATVDSLTFSASNNITFSTAAGLTLTTTQVFRDPGAWMHIVLRYDQAQPVAADRVKLYVNGVEITSFVVDNRGSLTPTSSRFNTAVIHSIGRHNNGSAFFDGYMADIYLIDGAALAPTAFGSFDADGIWQPGPQYAGAYGTNGFFLDTAEVVGGSSVLDSGPNGLTWTPVNFDFNPTSFDFHGSYDSPADNYCHMGSVFLTGSTVRGGGLDITNVTTNPSVVNGTFGISYGKWYWEVEAEVVTGSFAGIINNTAREATDGRTDYPGRSADGYSLAFATGNKVNASVAGVAYGTPIVANDVVMVAFDADNGKIWFGKNGTWFGGGDPAAGTGEAFAGIPLTREVYFPAHGNNAAAGVSHYNFGQRDFKHVPPAGFGKLRASSLNPVAIIDGEDYFDAKLYAGTGAAQSITGYNFQPDLVEVRPRTAQGTNSPIYDAVRGAQRRWSIEQAAAEAVTDDGVTGFLANGFSLGTQALVNNAGRNFVGAAWKQGNVPGLQIITYTGDGAASRNIAHTLGKKPAMIIIKARTSANFGVMYHQWGGWPGNAPETGGMPFNLATTQWAVVASLWNNTAPTAAQFTVGNDVRVNAAGVDYVAYVWCEVEGFSKFGLYYANGNANGAFAYCGFRPQWFFCMESDTLAAPTGMDDARNPRNVQGTAFRWMSNTTSESTTDDMDFVSNGAKMRATGNQTNQAATLRYMFAAFAHHPFKHGRAR